jgi:hypothetical protein
MLMYFFEDYQKVKMTGPERFKQDKEKQALMKQLKLELKQAQLEMNDYEKRYDKFIKEYDRTNNIYCDEHTKIDNKIYKIELKMLQLKPDDSEISKAKKVLKDNGFIVKINKKGK